METPSTTADISSIRRSIDESLAKMDSLIESLKLERENIRSTIESRVEELALTRYTKEQQQQKEELDDFLKEPYVIIPKRENEFYVIAPRWLNFQIGWLERQTKSYNIFVVNRYVQWISPVPDALRQKLRFPTELPQLKIVGDNTLWTGKEHQEDAFQRYRQFIQSKEGDDRLRIRKGYEFKLISRLIEDGILPFIPRPVEPSDLREEFSGMEQQQPLELRSYQTKAWEEFLNKGACGVFWPFGSGKSLFGVYALLRIKGRKLVVVPTLTLKEQWLERIKKYIPSSQQQEITVQTYQGYEKLRDKEYTLVVFDEVHHLPANTFVRLATLKTKYRLGLSASPFREDRRESYIFALTGFPLGISWDELLNLSVVRQPSFKLYLLKSNSEKISLTASACCAITIGCLG
jgi:Type III restriction enzyme, res subunit